MGLDKRRRHSSHISEQEAIKELDKHLQRSTRDLERGVTTRRNYFLVQGG